MKEEEVPDFDPPENLQETWQTEDKGIGEDPLILDVFGQDGGRMPTLDEIEEDHATDLP